MALWVCFPVLLQSISFELSVSSGIIFLVILMKSRVLVTMDPYGLVEAPCVEGQVRAGNQTHQAIQFNSLSVLVLWVPITTTIVRWSFLDTQKKGLLKFSAYMLLPTSVRMVDAGLQETSKCLSV